MLGAARWSDGAASLAVSYTFLAAASVKGYRRISKLDPSGIIAYPGILFRDLGCMGHNFGALEAMCFQAHSTFIIKNSQSHQSWLWASFCSGKTSALFRDVIPAISGMRQSCRDHRLLLPIV